MNIDKAQILQLLKSQGQHDTAAQADQQLPDQVDTDSDDHKGMLSNLGIDPSMITGLLGGGGGGGGGGLGGIGGELGKLI